MPKMKSFKVEYNIIPKSWLMPYDYKDFIKDKEVGFSLNL